MSFSDFDKRFARARRSGRLFRAFVLTWIGVVFAVVVAAAVTILATAIRLGPDGLASEAGRLVAVFEGGYESERAR